jgi:hypothetical protein
MVRGIYYWKQHARIYFFENATKHNCVHRSQRVDDTVQRVPDTADTVAPVDGDER